MKLGSSFLTPGIGKVISAHVSHFIGPGFNSTPRRSSQFICRNMCQNHLRAGERKEMAGFFFLFFFKLVGFSFQGHWVLKRWFSAIVLRLASVFGIIIESSLADFFFSPVVYTQRKRGPIYRRLMWLSLCSFNTLTLVCVHPCASFCRQIFSVSRSSFLKKNTSYFCETATLTGVWKVHLQSNPHVPLLHLYEAIQFLFDVALFL